MFCCFDWLQGGIVSLHIFQCCLGGMNLSSSWMRGFFGVRMLTSSSLLTFPKCLGELEGQMLRLGLKHSLDGLLHQTRAIGGACCFLHKALFPHPIPSCTALESSYSGGCLLTCSLKKQQHFVENFVRQGWKKLPSFWCSKHRDWETLPASQYWTFKGGSCGGRDLCGEKKFWR